MPKHKTPVARDDSRELIATLAPDFVNNTDLLQGLTHRQIAVTLKKPAARTLQTIKLLVTKNPRKPDTKGNRKWKLLKDGMSVSAFIDKVKADPALGNYQGFLRTEVAKERIKIGK